MLGFFITWFTNTLALLIVVRLLPGIQVDQWETTALAALVLGLLNAFLRPLLIFFTLPLHFVSLGFFTLVINGFMFYLVSKIVEGFVVVNFWSAFFGALLFSVVSFLLNFFIDPNGRLKVRVYRQRSFYDSKPTHVIDIEGKSKDDEA